MGFGDPVIYYNSAQGGLRPLPDQRVTRLGGAHVSVDKNGYRTTTTPSDSSFRILYLGDSVTWGGSSIDDTRIFSEQSAIRLRESGRAVYAMNAGVNSSSLMNQAGVYQETPGHIDAIVWLFPSGDLYRTFTSAGYLWPPTKKPRFALVEVVDKVIQIFWLPRFRQETASGTRRYTRASVPKGHEAFYESVFEERFESNVQAFEAVLADAASRGIPVLTGITPEFVDSVVRAPEREALQLMERADLLGALVLDLHTPFQSASDPGILYLDSVHFAEPGHALVGLNVAEALSALLPAEKAD